MLASNGENSSPPFTCNSLDQPDLRLLPLKSNLLMDSVTKSQSTKLALKAITKSTPKKASTKAKDPKAKKTNVKHLFTSSQKSAAKRTLIFPKKTAKIVRFFGEDYVWHCWQCLRAFISEGDFGKHVKSCSSRHPQLLSTTTNLQSLPGCPFCPRDGFQANAKPFFFDEFNAHIRATHNDVKQLSCPYCLAKTARRLQDLTSHIVLEHKIHWRPSPASLVYLRVDDIAHRVVTCLGCGWCTFVLRASDAAQPPTSLSSHLTRCAGNGGLLSLSRVPFESGSHVPRATIIQLTDDAITVADEFTRRFPGIRGYLPASGLDDALVLPASGLSLPRPPRLRYESPLRRQKIITPRLHLEYEVEKSIERTPTTVNEELKFSNSVDGEGTTLDLAAVSEEEQDQGAYPEIITNGSDSASTQPLQPAKPISSDKKNSLSISRGNLSFLQSNSASKSIFDVPLDLPPPPPQSLRPAKKVASRVYVCPICGDNALASLRERDEHLQAEHNGELVFPCQLCGMAYPLYIALRRHAVLKHSSNFDAVLYGQLDADPVDCPYCELVAFTTPEVLQLHLAKLHPDQVQQQAVVAAVASVLGPGEDDENDKDWTESGKTPADKKPKEIGNKRGKQSETNDQFSAVDLLDDTDLLESVESPFAKPIAKGSSSFRVSKGTRGRSGNGVAGRGRGGRGTRGGRGRGRGRGARTLISSDTAGFMEQDSMYTMIPTTDGSVSLVAAAAGGADSTILITAGDNMLLESSLEAVLHITPGVHAPLTCRLCGPQNQVVLDNAKELCVHLELDHKLVASCEQLGCQACGRIFFGPHHREDLIGHFRISHQDGEENQAFKCPNYEPVHFASDLETPVAASSVIITTTSGVVGGVASLPTAVAPVTVASTAPLFTGGGCPAKFTSTRLRDSHLMAPVDSQWACPLQLEAELLQAMSSPMQHMVDGSSFDPIVLATEIAADAAGQMILAYGCPNCSRVFTGDNCTTRYLTHRTRCDALAAAAADDQYAIVATATLPTSMES